MLQLIYAKPKQQNNNKKNNILSNDTMADSMATKTQDMSEVEKTNMTKGKKSQKISPPPLAPEEPITSEKSSTVHKKSEP